MLLETSTRDWRKQKKKDRKLNTKISKVFQTERKKENEQLLMEYPYVNKYRYFRSDKGKEKTMDKENVFSKIITENFSNLGRNINKFQEAPSPPGRHGQKRFS